jgi:hypothetical protein
MSRRWSFVPLAVNHKVRGAYPSVYQAPVFGAY